MAKPDNKIDFGGYVTRYNIECSDGRTIAPGAFKHMDGRRVPFVWQHLSDNPENIMGNATLHDRDDGVYADFSLNKSTRASALRETVEHGDITGLSIFANRLIEKGTRVTHGQIIEASAVMLGANSGAHIDDTAVMHSDGESGTEAIIGWVEDEDVGLEMFHDDTTPDPVVPEQVAPPAAEEPKAVEPETVQAPAVVLSDTAKQIVESIKSGTISLRDAQTENAEFFQNISEGELALLKTALGELAIELSHSDKAGDKSNMRIFDQTTTQKENPNVLKHDQYMSILEGVSKHGSLKKSFLAHAETFGFNPIKMLFPQPVNQPSDPIVIQRQQAWVNAFYGGAFKSPFTTVRTIYADITASAARARGYTKGGLKIEQVIELLKRESRPTTVYAKQAIANDDVIDITDFAVVDFMWRVMEQSIFEELAVAGLLGDGRSALSPDKVKEDAIRPIYKDHNFFSHRISLPETVGGMNAAETLKMVDAVALARRFYRGSGMPTFFTTPEFLANIITLREPTTGTRYYATEAELMAQMRISGIAEVPQMEGLIRTEGAVDYGLVGIVVNPIDYTFGNNPAGGMQTFTDFDIDYNLHKMLMETRRSGGLVLPKSALIIEKAGWSTTAEPALPTDIDDTEV
jgi:HK97 family phage prohead protease